MRKFKPRLLMALSVFAVLIVVLSGCPTSTQVQNMINDANQAAIAGSLDASAASIAPFPSTAINADDSAIAPDAAARLSNWIAQHQDQPRIVDPLRLRLAYLLLQQGKPNSAQVVFDDITGRDMLPSELQQVLYDHWEAFKWWWPAKGQKSFSNTDHENAVKFSQQLVDDAGAGDRTPYIRAMLNQFAIDIRFKNAVRTANTESVESQTRKALDEYAAQFSTTERAAIQQLNTGTAAANDLDGTMLRWYIRVPLTYACFEKLWKVLEIEGSEGLTPNWGKSNQSDLCPISF